MAEDKGSGGSSWGTFEVVLVILLVAGVLGRLQGKPFGAIDNPKEESVTQNFSENQKNNCGLNIINPKSFEKITSSFIIEGYTFGCDWVSSENVALYLQVVDSKGLPVSNYTTIVPSSFDQSTLGANFSTIINLNTKANPGTGYVILLPMKNDDKNTITHRIPVNF